MAPYAARQVEVVVINWKRPLNVAEIVLALRHQSVPCTITLCDCHDSPEFALPSETIAAADRIYRWQHNLGAFSRYVPVGGYDHKYTFFIDDDMLPGSRCVEHFLIWAEHLRTFGALGQIGRIARADGVYQPRDVSRNADFTEVDVLARAFFVRTNSLVHVQQMRTLVDGSADPEDDILLAIGLAIHGAMRCFLTPADADPQTLVNVRELGSGYSRSGRPNHLQLRTRLLQRAMELGWQPQLSRGSAMTLSDGSPGDLGGKRGVLYLAVGDLHRALAIASISSLRRYGYEGSIRVVTDQQGWIPPELSCESVLVPAVSDGFSTRRYKTRLYQYAYDTTLFLDSDAIVVADIGQVWGLLDNCDIAMAADLRPSIEELIASDRDRKDARAEFNLMIRLGLTNRAHYNSGVMLFRRSSAVEDLFDSWHAEWQRYRRRDQLALVRAIALTDPAVRPLPVIWNCPAATVSSIRAAQSAGIKVLHFLSRHRGAMTTELASALGNRRAYPAGGDWEEQPLREFGRLDRVSGDGCDHEPGECRAGGFLAATRAGGDEHFEMVIPSPRGGVDNYWRARHASRDSWSEPVTVGHEWGRADAACLIQDSAARQDNLELVIRAGSRLAHYTRRPFPNWQWQEASWLTDGVAGNPSLVLSGSAADGRLELIVPLLSGGVAHYRGRGGDAAAQWTAHGVFAQDLGHVDAVALVRDHISSPTRLTAIVRTGDQLLHYWWEEREQRWFGPQLVFTGAAGVPGMVQRELSSPGNLEVLTPVQDGGMVHLWHSRDSSSSWQRTTYLDPGGAPVDAVSLTESCTQSSPVDLEAAVVTETEVRWYWRQYGPFGFWSSMEL
jgi:hypothetical protein